MPDPTTYTPHFAHHAGRLFCENVDLERVAQKVGTPAYVYSAASIRAAYRRLDRAFTGLPHHLCYSVKANSNLSILRLLAAQGSYFDIVSGGELHRVLRAGVSAKRVVFSGVGKTREEIREALRAGILLFNAESESEVAAIVVEAMNLRRPANLGLRVNPDVAAGGHPHISTGARSHKFGVDLDDARRIYGDWRHSRWITWRGISAHIGSQILRVSPFRTAVGRLASFVRSLARDGIPLQYFDFGGGIGIRYTDESPLPLREYAKVLRDAVKPLGCKLLLEPGRTIVGPAGVLLTRVVRTKKNRGKWFVVTDAAMNDLLRPALYGATHPITKINSEDRNVKYIKRDPTMQVTMSEEALVHDDFRFSDSEFRVADVVGPICETGDCFLRDWPIGPVHEGDLLAVWGTGAYGFALSSNYNSRPRAAEVLVDGPRHRIIRRRESRADLLHPEVNS